MSLSCIGEWRILWLAMLIPSLDILATDNRVRQDHLSARRAESFFNTKVASLSNNPSMETTKGVKWWH
jgi:hypothetical protein